MAVSKVLCIELGDTTKIAEVDYKKPNPKIYQSEIFNLRDTQLGANGDVGVDDDGLIRGRDTVAKILESKIKELKFGNNNVVFSIISTKILTRDVTIPNVKPAQIKNMITTQAGQYFPVEVNDYEYSYSIIDKTADKQLHIMVYAISKQLVKSYVALADAAHLNLVGLEYGGNAQFQVLTKKVQPANTATTYIDINESNSVVSILKDGKLELQRTISYGTNQIINRIRDYKSYSNLNTSQLFDLVRNEQFVRERFDEDDLSMMNMDENMSDEASVAAFEKLDIKDGIIDDLRAFINSVSRQVDSYRSKNRNVQINPNTFVLGKGSLVKGMLELLSNELGTKTEMLTNIPGLDFPKKYNNDVVVQMYTVVGAGIAPIEFEILREENVKKKESENLTVYYLATLVALVISIALIGIGLIRMQTAKSENKKKKEKIEALTNELGDIYDKWEASKAAVSQIQLFDDSTYAYTSKFNEFLTSFEETIPSDAMIGTFSMSKNVISMGVTTTSEETAAQFVQLVRNMELVDSVEMSGIAIAVNEETVPATTTVSFTVDVTLVDPDPSEFESGYVINPDEKTPNSNSGYAKDPIFEKKE